MTLKTQRPVLAQVLEEGARGGWDSLTEHTLAMVASIVREYALGPADTVALISLVLEYHDELRRIQRGGGRA
jgi:hypothetical protein